MRMKMRMNMRMTWSGLCAVALLSACSSEPTTPQPDFNQFVQGERVKMIRDGIVRISPGAFNAPAGTQLKNAQAAIVSGTSVVDATGDNTRYWQVDFDTGVDGWVSGIYLTSVTEGGAPPTFWASPTGLQTNPGTQASPWSLSWAMSSANTAVTPGTTVWLLGGTYTGNYNATTVGTAAQRIVYRQAAGVRATIDGELHAQGSYLTFWGFEIKQSQPNGSLYNLRAQTYNGRFINLVIHDAGSHGISIYYPPGDTTEIYGSIIYNNGTNQNDGAFVESSAGYRILRDNVFFNNTANGLEAYTDAGNSNQLNIHSIGNVAFNNGTTAYAGWGYHWKPNIRIGASNPVTTDGVRVDTNFAYFSIHPNPSQWNMMLGQGDIGAQSQNGSILARGNTSWAGTAWRMTNWTTATVSGNTVFAPGASRLIDLIDPTTTGHAWSGNTYLIPATLQNWYYLDQWYALSAWQTATGLGTTGASATIPTQPTVIVRANKYEPGRAMIVINNDNGAGAARVGTNITVTLPAGILTSGQAYSIHNVQDFYGTPVASGTYNGTSVTITSTAMAGGAPPPLLGTGRTWDVAQPPPTTGPRFNAFILTSP